MSAWGVKINTSCSRYHCKGLGLDAAMPTVENTCWLTLRDMGSWYVTTLAKLLLADASSVVGKAVDYRIAIIIEALVGG